MTRLLLPLLALLATLGLAAAPARGADADLKADLAKLQGQWKANFTLDGSTTVWRLDIKGQKAKLTVKDKDDGDVFKAEFDFKLEVQGKFRAFTYFNLKHLSGDKQGDKEFTGGQTRSSIYKFDGDSAFATIGGFREDYEDPQWLMKWEKIKE